MKPLTKRQAEVLAVIKGWIEARGKAPTGAEIARKLGYGRGGSRDHILALERKGYIRRDPGVRRGIELIETHGDESIEA